VILFLPSGDVAVIEASAAAAVGMVVIPSAAAPAVTAAPLRSLRRDIPDVSTADTPLH
jgi:hypothetical protein